MKFFYSLKGIWILWSFVTVIVLISFILNIIDLFILHTKLDNYVDELKKIYPQSNSTDGKVKFWEESDTKGIVHTISYIFVPIPLILVGLGHFMIYRAYKGASLGHVTFLILSFFSLIVLIFGIVSLADSSPFSDIISSNSQNNDQYDVIINLLKNKQNKLHLKAYSYAEMVLTIIKLFTTVGVWYIVKQMFASKSSRSNPAM